jgi:fructose-1,6-bisphosphatase I/sedoheptulose-1,7-bisphosphatase/fructose-1,6-bisphosphatase I
MESGRTSLTAFLAQESSTIQAEYRSNLPQLILQLSTAIKKIAHLTSQGALAGALGSLDSQNVQGETQKKLDVFSDDILIETFKKGGLVAGIASEEVDEPISIPYTGEQKPFLTLFDPLDGSSNIDVNVSVGSIFSILPAPRGREPALADYLQHGRKQICAGYAIYGPATMLILSLGKGTHGFTLDSASQEFFLTHPNIQIPAETSEFAINASNERFWEPPVSRYIAECKKGKTDVRGRDFNMRWIASMVADVHRILMRGGVFMYPRDTKDPSKPGRLRLMYEANPMTFVVEQAGGLGSTGRARILDLAPESIHQRVAVILGSRNEIERLEQYHRDDDVKTKLNSPIP